MNAVRPDDVPAVILAAGLSSRMSGITTQPKCLTPILGRALIGWVLDALEAAGIRRIVVLLGHQPDSISDALVRMNSAISIDTHLCTDWKLGNGNTAAEAERVLGRAERFLLLMSDHLVSAEHIRKTLRAADEHQRCCVLATSVPPYADSDDATRVRINDNGFVAELGKGLIDYNGIDSGVFAMTPDLFRALSRARALGDHSLTGANRILAQDNLLVSCELGNTGWQDVDTAADLAAAEQLARSMRPDLGGGA